MSQAETQGIYSSRIEHLNEFRTGMADRALALNALSQLVQVKLMEKSVDIYGDTEVKLEAEVTKRVVVTKNPEMSYVANQFDLLVEDDEDRIPWLVKLTQSGLPRLIRHDDRMIIGGIEYSVSAVSPINRLNDGLLKVLIYPERSSNEE